MRIAVVDVGSNTARLLVAETDGEAVEPIGRDKAFLRLGAEIEERGTIRPRKLRETAEIVARLATHAGDLGARHGEVVVTAPGRHPACGEALLAAIRAAAPFPVRALGGEEEGRLAFDGAVRSLAGLPGVVAVVDVGGGSTEVAVGSPTFGAAWVRSVDLGSLRLTRRCLPGDPPGPEAAASARRLATAAIAGLHVPHPEAGIAVGGTARAASRALGGLLEAPALDELAERFATGRAEKIARRSRISADRASTMLGGLLLLAATARELGVPLRVATGGLREGVALQLAARAARDAA